MASVGMHWQTLYDEMEPAHTDIEDESYCAWLDNRKKDEDYYTEEEINGI